MKRKAFTFRLLATLSLVLLLNVTSCDSRSKIAPEDSTTEETIPPKEETPPEETTPPDGTKPPDETTPPDGTKPPDETKPPEETTPPEETAPPEEKPFVREVYSTQYIETRTGNYPVILSVPHGGYTEGTNFIKRTKTNTGDPSFASGRDSYTQELADLIDDEFFALTGRRPYMVICKIRRLYIDMNRNRSYALPGEDAPQAYIYDRYHRTINDFKDLIVESFGQGLLLDIHGHGHAVQQIELGYGLSKAELNRTNASLNTITLSKKSSIHSISSNNLNNLSFIEVLRGSNSFGDLLVANNLPCVPHSNKLGPGTESYFSGGFITVTHGSRSSTKDGGKIDAIQMEFDGDSRKIAVRAQTAKSVTTAVTQFINIHYPLKRELN